jgi:cytochrome o ubiquinol oxidase subunit 2
MSSTVRHGVQTALLTVWPGLLGGCAGQGVIDPQGPVADAERMILMNSTAIMLCVVLPVIVLTLIFALRYRASKARAYEPEWGYSGKIELVVWSIPALTVILLSGVGWIGSHDLEPSRPLPGHSPALHIEVVALDWKWLFLYPEQHVAALNEITVPVGTPLALDITSGTVMTAFFVPQLGSQIYAMPGMTTHLNLLASAPGHYPGFAAHFSGNGFSDMRFVVHAVPAAQYAAWLQQVRSSGDELDSQRYDALARAATNVPVQTFRTVSNGLFEHALRYSLQPPTSAPGG